MKTTENNKLIAEFIGMQETKLGWFDNEEVLNLIYDLSNTFDDLLFHKSWDWLMPVISKIYSSKEYYKYKDTLGQFNEGIFINTKFITVTHESVVEFIKWYNENK